MPKAQEIQESRPGDTSCPGDPSRPGHTSRAGDTYLSRAGSDYRPQVVSQVSSCRCGGGECRRAGQW
jgi:hypothetical protein